MRGSFDCVPAHYITWYLIIVVYVEVCIICLKGLKHLCAPFLKTHLLCSGGGGLQSSGGAAASVLTPSAPMAMEERIPHSKRNVAVSTGVEIAVIAEKIQDWEAIAPYLGISAPQVEVIKMNHYNYEDQKLVMRPP